MEKIIFANGTELEIKEGASLDHITVVVETFADLEPVAEVLTTEGNLEKVQFETNGNISGEYEGLVLVKPVFHSVDIVDGKVEATFFFREKTELEKHLEELNGTVNTMLGTEV